MANAATARKCSATCKRMSRGGEGCSADKQQAPLFPGRVCAILPGHLYQRITLYPSDFAHQVCRCPSVVWGR